MDAGERSLFMPVVSLSAMAVSNEIFAIKNIMRTITTEPIFTPITFLTISIGVIVHEGTIGTIKSKL